MSRFHVSCRRGGPRNTACSWSAASSSSITARPLPLSTAFRLSSSRGLLLSVLIPAYRTSQSRPAPLSRIMYNCLILLKSITRPVPGVEDLSRLFCQTGRASLTSARLALIWRKILSRHLPGSEMTRLQYLIA